MVNMIDELTYKIILTQLESYESLINKDYNKYRELANLINSLLDRLYLLVNDVEHADRYDYPKMVEYMKNWCVNKYGFDYRDFTLAQFKRHIILNEFV